MSAGMATPAEHKATVLLIDDQPMIGEAVRRMLAGEPDIVFHYCKDATKAIESAEAIGPTVILQDLVMPDIDGLTLVKMFRANASTRETPMIVLSTKEEPKIKSDAFALGANDYIVKLPDRLELLARIRHHSRGYINMIERNEAYQALAASQRALAKDVAQAAKYVESLLPEPLRAGPIQAEWRFIPSAHLGGDSFGYHRLDDEHFAFYLLDVCGHGVGAALLSVSALNALRAQALPQTDFRQPGQVLEALNRAFPMEQQDGKFFTIWYGVYHIPTRRLDYAGGGHPPAVLMTGPSVEQAAPVLLKSAGLMIGADADLVYRTSTCQVDAYGKLLLYSDGVFEIALPPDGAMWPYESFIEFMGQPSQPGLSDMDRLIAHVRALGGRDDFIDDFSIVELRFAPPG